MKTDCTKKQQFLWRLYAYSTFMVHVSSMGSWIKIDLHLLWGFTQMGSLAPWMSLFPQYWKARINRSAWWITRELYLHYICEWTKQENQKNRKISAGMSTFNYTTQVPYLSARDSQEGEEDATTLLKTVWMYRSQGLCGPNPPKKSK